MNKKMQLPDELGQLMSEYGSKGISRREFLQRALIMGMSLPAATSFLANASQALTRDSARRQEPVQGGTFVEGYDRDFSKVEPIAPGWDDPTLVAVYEFPVIRDPSGAPVPMVAESWTVSDDGLTWTFKIREGLKFHSGAPCTNAQIVQNFDAFRMDGMGQNSVFWVPIDTVTAGDGNTVIVQMKTPFAAFPETLATENSMICNLDARALAPDTFGSTAADGTGPFTFVSYAPGDQVVVARWPDYPGSIVPFVENKGPAYLDEIRWVPILEPANRANELEAGGVDAVKNPSPQDAARLEANPDIVTVEFPQPANFYITLNQTKTELGFNDLNVRQAISHAIDRNGIAQSVFFGKAVGTQGPIASNWRWYDAGVEAFNQYDPELAKSMLDSAGWAVGSDGIREKDGKKMSFTCVVQTDQSNAVLAAQAVTAMLADVGVDMQVSRVPGSDIVTARAESEAYGLEWLWSAQADVLVFFYNIPSLEYTGGDPDVGAAFEAYQGARDNAELEAAARQAQLLWAERLPTIPIVTVNNIWAFKKTVHGWTPNQAMLYPLYNDVWKEA